MDILAARLETRFRGKGTVQEIENVTYPNGVTTNYTYDKKMKKGTVLFIDANTPCH